MLRRWFIGLCPSEWFLVAKVQLRPTQPPQVQAETPLSPALWVLVLLATLGSICALTFWLLIYRRRRSSTGASGGKGDTFWFLVVKQREGRLTFVNLSSALRGRWQVGDEAPRSRLQKLRSFSSVLRIPMGQPPHAHQLFW